MANACTNLETIPLKDRTITAMRDTRDGEYHIPLRPACVSMKLSYPGQLERIRRQHWATVRVTRTVAEDGKDRELVTLDRKTFTYWLATITASRIKDDEARRTVELFQLEAVDALDRYFANEPKPLIVSRPWSERFMATLQPHWQYVNLHFPGCFTIATASVIQIFGLEDNLLRHEFEVSSSDRPDGSVGLCWAHYRRKHGMPEVVKKAPLYLPDSGYYVDLLAYDNSERGTFEEWILGPYMTEKMPSYLWNKPSFKRYGELPVASVAENTCLSLTGSPARIKPKVRKLLDRAGGFCPAGYQPPQIQHAQRTLFDQSA